MRGKKTNEPNKCLESKAEIEMVIDWVLQGSLIHMFKIEMPFSTPFQFVI